MPERLEIIFDTAERFPGRASFDISYRDMRYVDHRDAGTPEASKIAHDFRATAERAGFRYVRGQVDEIRRFVSALPEAAKDPRSLPSEKMSDTHWRHLRSITPTSTRHGIHKATMTTPWATRAGPNPLTRSSLE